MSALRALRTLIGAALLAPGLAVANGTGPGVAGPQAVPAGTATTPTLAPPPPVWLPMAPFPGAQAYFYYPMQQPGMMWPMPYPYPVPQMAPPFVWIPMLVQALPQQARPATVDYGPVADTPVVELPPLEATPAAALPEGATPAAPAGQVVEPATVALSQAARLSVERDEAPAAEPEDPAAAAAANAVTVDYGPVAPTPVVNLLALQRPASGPKPRKRLRAAPNPLRKPVTTPPPKARPAATTAPAKPRMCWTRGVVAPCP